MCNRAEFETLFGAIHRLRDKQTKGGAKMQFVFRDFFLVKLIN